MKTSNQPRLLTQALEWIASLNGQARLAVLVEVGTGKALRGYCMKAGKPSTLEQFRQERKSEGHDVATWAIMSYQVARDWQRNSNSSTNDVPRETKQQEETMPIIDTVESDKPVNVPRETKQQEETMPIIDTVESDKPVNVPRETTAAATSIAGANAIATLIHNAINAAMDVDALKATANAKLDEAIKGLVTPTIISVQNGADAPVVPIGTAHFKFPKLLQMCNARDASGNRLNVRMVGPAGTSKTHSAKQVAQAMGLPFYPFSAIADEYKLSGFRDANGNVVRTTWREFVEFGGVACLDEFSAGDANAILSVNAFTANGVFAFPDAIIERHPNCVLIAGDNVFSGATAEFNGRNKLDDSSVDRFVDIEWPIDTVLERVITGNDEWVSVVQSMRQAAQDLGLKVMITPRASYNGAALLRAGMSQYDAAEACMRRGMDDSAWRKLCAKVGLAVE